MFLCVIFNCLLGDKMSNSLIKFSRLFNNSLIGKDSRKERQTNHVVMWERSVFVKVARADIKMMKEKEGRFWVIVPNRRSGWLCGAAPGLYCRLLAGKVVQSVSQSVGRILATFSLA